MRSQPRPVRQNRGAWPGCCRHNRAGGSELPDSGLAVARPAAGARPRSARWARGRPGRRSRGPPSPVPRRRSRPGASTPSWRRSWRARGGAVQASGTRRQADAPATACTPTAKGAAGRKRRKNWWSHPWAAQRPTPRHTRQGRSSRPMHDCPQMGRSRTPGAHALRPPFLFRRVGCRGGVHSPVEVTRFDRASDAFRRPCTAPLPARLGGTVEGIRTSV